MQIALLIDNSQAADPYVRDLREAAHGLHHGDRRTTRAEPGTRWRSSRSASGRRSTPTTPPNLEQAIKGAQRIFATPGSGAYLLDGIIETSKGIKKRESPRPVIVAVITAGVELSDRPYQSAARTAARVGGGVSRPGRRTPAHRHQDRMMVLDLGTRDTGGRYDTVLTGTGLTPRMKQLAEELTHQYKVTYAHPETLIPPDRVDHRRSQARTHRARHRPERSYRKRQAVTRSTLHAHGAPDDARSARCWRASRWCSRARSSLVAPPLPHHRHRRQRLRRRVPPLRHPPARSSRRSARASTSCR